MKIRRTNAKDIIQGNEVILLGDNEELFVLKIEEVLNPSDNWKAFCADDGCRYGLENTWVIEKDNTNTDIIKELERIKEQIIKQQQEIEEIWNNVVSIKKEEDVWNLESEIKDIDKYKDSKGIYSPDSIIKLKEKILEDLDLEFDYFDGKKINFGDTVMINKQEAKTRITEIINKRFGE